MQNTPTDHDPAAYGDACATFYDQLYGPLPRAVVRSLVELAGDGRVLELGSATGRTARALRAAGIEHYVGVEASRAMIDTMRAKPECREVAVVHGDFADCALPGTFDLIFALVSTFQLLPTPARQASAMLHLAAHLNRDGIFLIESFDPADASTQTMDKVHRIETAQGPRDYPVTGYPSTRSALDAMATTAGLKLHARWCNWQRQPHHDQAQHISLYRHV